jgi:hypothetical protein
MGPGRRAAWYHVPGLSPTLIRLATDRSHPWLVRHRPSSRTNAFPTSPITSIRSSTHPTEMLVLVPNPIRNPATPSPSTTFWSRPITRCYPIAMPGANGRSDPTPVFGLTLTTFDPTLSRSTRPPFGPSDPGTVRTGHDRLRAISIRSALLPVDAAPDHGGSRRRSPVSTPCPLPQILTPVIVNAGPVIVDPTP